MSVGPTSRHCKWVSLSTRLVETVSVVTRTTNLYTQRDHRVLFRAYFADRFGDLSRDPIYVNDVRINGRCPVGVLTYVGAPYGVQLHKYRNITVFKLVSRCQRTISEVHSSKTRRILLNVDTRFTDVRVIKFNVHSIRWYTYNCCHANSPLGVRIAEQVYFLFLCSSNRASI